MYESFADFFTALWQGSFGFDKLYAWLYSVFFGMIDMPDLAFIKGTVDSFYFKLGYLFALILVVLSLLIAFFGKKLLPILKFLGFFVIGFTAGAYFVTPLIEILLYIPAWVSGLVIGVVCAVLYRFIYYALYAILVTYSGYVLCYTGAALVHGSEHTTVRAVTAIAVAAVITILAFILKKYVEMLYTAALGGAFVFASINSFAYEITSLEFISDFTWVAPLVFILVIGVPGFIVQVKTRKRY